MGFTIRPIFKSQIDVKTLSLIILAIIAHTSVSAADQVCDESLPAWTPDDQFENHNDGTVTDTRTGLTWQTCELGKSGADCQGTSTQMGWDEATQVAKSSKVGGFDDWRLPTIEELLSIAEDRCINPSINASVFPNSSSSQVWTSWIADELKGGAWFVLFLDGTPGLQYKGDPAAIRLVRSTN